MCPTTRLRPYNNIIYIYVYTPSPPHTYTPSHQRVRDIRQMRRDSGVKETKTTALICVPRAKQECSSPVRVIVTIKSTIGVGTKNIISTSVIMCRDGCVTKGKKVAQPIVRSRPARFDSYSNSVFRHDVTPRN